MAAAHFVLSLCLAPLLPGILGWVAALTVGGPRRSVFFYYRQWFALAQTGTAYASGTSLAARSAPAIILACLIAALGLVPVGGQSPLPMFAGDFTLVVFFLILAKAVAHMAGSEDGPLYGVSSAAGPGGWASPLYMLAEPLLLCTLASLGTVAGSYSLGGMFAPSAHFGWQTDWPVLLPVTLALLCLVCLEEQTAPQGVYDDPALWADGESRLPPGALDRALRDYGQALKLWFLAALVSGLFPPRLGDPLEAFGAGVGGIFMVVIVMGMLKGLLARMRKNGGCLLAAAAAFTIIACAAAVFMATA